MAKKPIKTATGNTKQMRVTVYFGYGLFLLTVIATAIWSVPWFSIIGTPRDPRGSVALILLTFLSAILVPPFVGYFVGDKATRRASRLIHHYNGVLYGIIGMWLVLIFNSILTYISWTYPIYIDERTYRLINISPVIAAVLLLVAGGSFYVRHGKRGTVLSGYAPYQRLLIGAIVGVLACIGASSLFGSMYHPDLLMSVFISLITPTLFLLAAALFGYWVLGARSGRPLERVTKSLVAISLGVACWMALGHLTGLGFEWLTLFLQIIGAVGVIVWLAYLVSMRRAAR